MKKIFNMIYKKNKLVAILKCDWANKILQFQYMNNSYRNIGKIGFIKFENETVAFYSLQEPEIKPTFEEVFLPGYNKENDKKNFYNYIQNKSCFRFFKDFFEQNRIIKL